MSTFLQEHSPEVAVSARDLQLGLISRLELGIGHSRFGPEGLAILGYPVQIGAICFPAGKVAIGQKQPAGTGHLDIHEHAIGRVGDDAGRLQRPVRIGDDRLGSGQGCPVQQDGLARIEGAQVLDARLPGEDLHPRQGKGAGHDVRVLVDANLVVVDELEAGIGDLALGHHIAHTE